jgi:ribA/ribD-fused uncharacterized protein
MERFTFFYGGPGSQWYPATFTVDGVQYNCGEQFMMAEKARLFGDDDAFYIIMQTTNPKIQKATGRLVKNFDRKIWEANAKLIVYRGNFARFSQNPDQLEWLLGTDGTTLVEASPWDKIWGIGLAANDPLALDRATWKGTNWLGEIETQVREDIKTLAERVGIGAAV